MSEHRGLFVVLEGSEGVGKSVNIEFIDGRLKQAGIKTLITREPGGTPLGEHLRTLLTARDSVPINANAELLLMFAARVQHLADVIVPAMEQGIWVICDRFTDASYAYQGGGRGLGGERIATLEKWAHADIQPDYVILLDAPVEAGLQRARHRGEKDRFEQEEIEFFERVRQVYLTRADGDPERYCVVDALQPLKQVQQQIDKILQTLIEKF